MMFAPTEGKPEGNQLRKEEALYFWRRFLLIALRYVRRLYTEKLTSLFFPFRKKQLARNALTPEQLNSTLQISHRQDVQKAFHLLCSTNCKVIRVNYAYNHIYVKPTYNKQR